MNRRVIIIIATCGLVFVLGAVILSQQKLSANNSSHQKKIAPYHRGTEQNDITTDKPQALHVDATNRGAKREANRDEVLLDVASENLPIIWLQRDVASGFIATLGLSHGDATHLQAELHSFYDRLREAQGNLLVERELPIGKKVTIPPLPAKLIKEFVDGMSFPNTTPEDVRTLVRKVALSQASKEFGDYIEAEFALRPVLTDSEMRGFGADAMIKSLSIKRGDKKRATWMYEPAKGDRFDFLKLHDDGE